MTRIQLALGLGLALAATPAPAQDVTWTRHPGSPVVSNSGSFFGAWDSIELHRPVIVSRSEGTWLYYHGSEGSDWDMGLATSADGLAFAKFGGSGQLVSGSGFDSYGVGPQAFLFEDGQWRCWYAAISFSGGPCTIAHMTSPDGVSWGERTILVDSAGAGFPITFQNFSILREPTHYRMWITDGSTQTIRHGVSTDGLSWTFDPLPVFGRGPAGAWDDGSIEVGSVIEEGSKLLLFYSAHGGPSGATGMGVAHSSDGLTWERPPGNRFLTTGAPGTWDSHYVRVPWAVRTAEGYRVYYEAGGPGIVTIPRIGLVIGTGHYSFEDADTTPPVLAVPADTDAIATSRDGATVAFSVTATDDVDGAVPAVCLPPSGSTFAPGTTAVACAATDAAGNTATASFDVRVAFAWSGVLEPLRPDETSVFRLGRTIPIKFELAGASAGIVDLEARLYVAKVSDGVAGIEQDASAPGNADSGNRFRSLGDGRYQFNLSTSGLTEGTWRIRIDFGDGVERVVQFALRS